MANPRTGRPLNGMPDYLAHWRAHRYFRDVPVIYRDRVAPALVAGLHPDRPGLTQLLTATLAGVRERHYSGFERNGGSGYSTKLIAELSEIFGLDEAQEAALYLWGRHQPPRITPGRDLDDSLLSALHEVPHPAMYVGRTTWDIEAYNETAAAHLPWITRPESNLAQLMLDPDASAQCGFIDWKTRWAGPTVAILKLSLESPNASDRLRQIAASASAHPEVRRIWDSDGAMRIHLDGDIRPVLIPTISPDPIRVELRTWIPERRRDLRLIQFVPLDGATAELLGPARSIPSAQRLADAVRVVTGASVVCVNYSTGLASQPNPRPGRVDLRLRRAAVSVAPGRTLRSTFLRPGDIIPPLPTTTEIQRHMRGNNIILRDGGYGSLAAAVEHDEHLMGQLIPSDDTTGVIHASLIPDGETEPLGSVEAFTDGLRFSDDTVAAMEYLARIRATAMIRAEQPRPDQDVP